MAPLKDYALKYETILMERRNGILQITFHTNGGPLQWGPEPHGEWPDAFHDIGSDPDNKVVIMTTLNRGYLELLALQLPFCKH